MTAKARLVFLVEAYFRPHGDFSERVAVRKSLSEAIDAVIAEERTAAVAEERVAFANREAGEYTMLRSQPGANYVRCEQCKNEFWKVAT